MSYTIPASSSYHNFIHKHQYSSKFDWSCRRYLLFLRHIIYCLVILMRILTTSKSYDASIWLFLDFPSWSLPNDQFVITFTCCQKVEISIFVSCKKINWSSCSNSKLVEWSIFDFCGICRWCIWIRNIFLQSFSLLYRRKSVKSHLSFSRKYFHSVVRMKRYSWSFMIRFFFRYSLNSLHESISYDRDEKSSKLPCVHFSVKRILLRWENTLIVTGYSLFRTYADVNECAKND